MPPDILTQYAPRALAASDVDLDGDVDLVVAADSVQLFRNSGNGPMGAGIDVDSIRDARPILIDVNLDGWPDLVVAAGGIRVSINLEGQGFAPPSLYPVRLDDHAMVAGDFNQDGMVDLAASDYVLLNNGDGTFTRGADLPTPEYISGLAAIDFDGDGDPDLAFSEPASNDVVILVNLGNGTFVVGTSIRFLTSPNILAVADGDRDGWDDLFTTSRGGLAVFFARNLLGTGFAQPDYFLTSRSICSMELADLDGDADIDAVVSHSDLDEVEIMLNDGLGALQSAKILPAGAGACALSLDDFNGDGRIDVATANTKTGTVSIFPGTPLGFVSRDTYHFSETLHDVAIADVNGDSSAELILSMGYGNGVIAVMQRKSDGSFIQSASYSVGGWLGSVRMADIDNDNDDDVLVLGVDIRSLAVLRNQGNGAFDPAVMYDIGSGASMLVPADVDQDGWVDVVVSNSQAKSVSVLRNLGAGIFAGQVLYPTGEGPVAVLAEDLDGDGYKDLITANKAGGTVSILYNRQDGTFRQHQDLSYCQATCYEPLAVMAADISLDGRTDLIVIDRQGLHVLQGREGVGFKWVEDIEDPYGYDAGMVGDFDMDGIPDVMACSWEGSFLGYFRGGPTGAFEENKVFAIGRHPSVLTHGDLNGDLWSDFVVLHEYLSLSIIYGRCGI